ncbi:MAG: putative calponin transgelin [Streblomastix strix]|uniref:Putative calponin transgelin n=1 Tax=Streblomastix strix TaxID=222440 RepID=A0A5J4WC23_9EUKA|nr:MAG: putative calponin transgelin [Streblomastix strix]
MQNQYGMDRELWLKQQSSVKEEDVVKARRWIEKSLGIPASSEPFNDWLHSGEILCDFINKLVPNKIPKINRKKMPFFQMENITSYCNACRELGVKDHDLFRTDDLYESKNIGQVLQSLSALNRVAKNIPGFQGPFLE